MSEKAPHVTHVTVTFPDEARAVRVLVVYEASRQQNLMDIVQLLQLRMVPSQVLYAMILGGKINS